eukprot:NODE_2197_length_1655_cov_48.281984_g1882_i0.p1 GENE.NODE_2197_length_1655_cov_48.281984_g1882_i0~~NODE_2197_length_1655_cov_48.281984_g1882_i0.p1  ORF type:complete len:551 (+),score=86.68 NODE_2197_length_1655_cov_48.281984_g1882_i0:166-1653(+)
MAGQEATEENAIDTPYDSTDADSVGRVKHTSLAHDTEGWHALETTLQCLLMLITGIGSAFAVEVTPGLLRLIYRACSHTNRFVREVSYLICGEIAEVLDSESLLVYGEDISFYIANGLTDRWCQVRYSACVGCRKFMSKLNIKAECYYHRLLPRLFINCRYPAEGVQIYAKDTWKMMFGASGRDYLSKVIEDTAGFMISQCLIDDQSVREAACHSIGEISTKLEPSIIEIYVPSFINVLTTCFKDHSWTVRDAACIALSNLVSTHMEQCTERIEDLHSLWLFSLSDSVWSVRETAAIALSTVAKNHQGTLSVCVSTINEWLPLVIQQPNDTQDDEHDEKLHTNRPTYPCCDLSSSKHSHSLDHNRVPEYWEKSDGALWLLREISNVSSESIEPCMKLLPKVAEVQHFRNYYKFLETYWKVVPVIMTNLGKKKFKRYMDSLLPGLYRGLKDEHGLVQSCACDATRLIHKYVGANIFRAHCDSEVPQIISVLPQDVL